MTLKGFGIRIDNIPKMSTEELLDTSSGWVNMDGFRGYYGFYVANELVKRGVCQFQASGPWGYILKVLQTST